MFIQVFGVFLEVNENVNYFKVNTAHGPVYLIKATFTFPNIKAHFVTDEKILRKKNLTAKELLSPIFSHV